MTSKCWTTAKGVQRHGKLIDKGYLYKMLKNPVYIGIAAHKGRHYPGEHEAIVAQALWDKVQSSLKEGVTRRKGQLAPRPSKAPTLLRGLVFGEDGRAFTPTYTSKGNRYYRYYVNTAAIKIGPRNCDVARVPAGEIEAVVVEQLRHVLQSPEVLAHTVREVVTLRPEITENQAIEALQSIDAVWDALFPAEQTRILQTMIERITVRPDGIRIDWKSEGIGDLLREALTTRPHSEAA